MTGPTPEYLYSLDQAADAMLIYDPSTLRIVDANAAACNLYGYDRAELLDREVDDLRPESERSFFRERLNAPSPRQPRSHGGVVRHCRRDGSIVEVELLSHPLQRNGHRLRLLTVRDVTAQSARQRADRRQALLFRDASDAVILTDATGRITDWNRGAERVFGWQREEVLGRVATFLHPAEEADPIAGRIMAALRHRALWEGQIRSVRKDGEPRICDVRVLPLSDDDGELIGTMVINRDVTEHRRATRALREAQARYRILAQQLPHMVWVSTPDGVVEYCNEYWDRYTGESMRSGSAEAWRHILHPEDEPTAVEAWTRSLETGDPHLVEHRIRRHDGTYRWHVSRATAMRDDDGRIVRWHGTTTDIHDRKTAEEAMRQREEYFRSVFEHAHDAILLCEEDARLVIDANPQAEALYGYDRDAFRKLSLLDLCEDPERVTACLARVREHGWDSFETGQHTRDGRKVRVEVNATLMEYRGRPVILTINRDVTERRLLERQLQQAQKMEAIGRLAGGLAHDFNNLTTAMQGFAALLGQKIDAKDEEAAGALAEIGTAASRASDLTRQMLAYTRQQVLRPRVLDLNATVESASQLLLRLIGEDVRFEVEPAAELDPVKADPVQMQQVLMNLAINARDAMPGGGTLRIETANVDLDETFAAVHPPVEPGRFVRLRVVDTGHGMDPETLDQVFEPFFTTKPVGEGTGLGLSTVYGIVKQSGGYIWADSEVGRGTAFEVYLPSRDEPIDAEMAPEPAWSGETPVSAGGETVLLVEDEAGVRKLSRMVLERAGFHVIEAENGQRALERIEASPGESIHLLLTDMVMPGMSGKRLAKEVSRRRPGIPILFMSGYTGESLSERGDLDGTDEVLEKPFVPRELVRTVQRLLLSSAPRE